ncbi:diguanylate cyclase domain-containing protein [Novosphingobium sp.]|uniref:GGDEF domain-containing protein n=1 Tax=Novosphingobium sp. TaxID=1874826 RepID=UPI0035B22721
MSTRGQRIREFFAPTIPAEIRDEFVLLSAAQLQQQSRWLFLALLLTTPTAALAASADANVWVRVGTPIAMALACLAGFLNVSRDLRLVGKPRRAAKFIREGTISSSLIAVMCSTWCVYSWLGAPEAERIYYPMIIALGAFSTAYCVSSARVAAIANLGINLIPMSVLLFTSGSRMDLAVAVSLLIAGAFQLHMIVQNQRNVVNLLSLQRQARELALSDPLTGLLNRRALLDNALALGGGEHLRLMLVDIDNFKAINDGFGHDTGDEVLVRVAERLACQAEIRGSVARIGGEEFAILGTAEELPASLALAVLADIRNAAMPHAQQVTVSIGVAEGRIAGEADWRELFNRADTALYSAKTGGRNRIVEDAAAPSPAPAIAAA